MTHSSSVCVLYIFSALCRGNRLVFTELLTVHNDVLTTSMNYLKEVINDAVQPCGENFYKGFCY